MHTIRIGTLVNASDAVQMIPKLLPHGFESFSVTFGESALSYDLPEYAKIVRGLAEEKGAVISSVGIYGNPLTNEGRFADSLESWQRLIDNAHLFGTDIVAGFTGRIPGCAIDKSIPQFKAVFGELSKRAEDKKVRIAFENCDMGGTWANGDFNIAHNPTAWAMMFEAVPSESLGLQWEPCHQMVSLIDPIPQLRKWAKKVYHVHGKDATIAWDIVREYGIHGPKEFVWHRTPGFGDSNWNDIITILRQNGFVGSIDIEGWHDPVYRGELEYSGQVRGLKYLKECRGGDFIKLEG